MNNGKRFFQREQDGIIIVVNETDIEKVVSLAGFDVHYTDRDCADASGTEEATDCEFLYENGVVLCLDGNVSWPWSLEFAILDGEQVSAEELFENLNTIEIITYYDGHNHQVVFLNDTDFSEIEIELGELLSEGDYNIQTGADDYYDAVVDGKNMIVKHHRQSGYASDYFATIELDCEDECQNQSL